jgi:endonuclease/exonuclease/phosphatase family metal-dependent hydrolase
MLTLMELNSANYDDHPGWLDRLGYIVKTIRACNADVVCLSEIRYTQANAFNSYAPTYWQNLGITPPPDPASMADEILTLLNARSGESWQQFTVQVDVYSPEQWEGLTILTNLPFTGSGSFTMPSQDGNARATQYMTVTTPSGNQVAIFNTHFALDPQSQIGDAQQVVKTVPPSLFIFTGDLNAEPDNDAIGILTNAGFVDIWAKLGSGVGFTFASPQPVKRIDYIFASPDVADAAQSIVFAPPDATGTSSYYTNSDAGTLFASDHIGLCAVFDI